MSETDPIIRTVEQQSDGLRVSVAGEVNLARSPELRSQLMELIEQQPQQLIVDLAAVEYMDSSGVATLIEVLRRQHQGGGTMALAGLRPKVRSIFEIARLDTVFTILDDAEQSGAV
jgi:anti-sigma B factor antagonist